LWMLHDTVIKGKQKSAPVYHSDGRMDKRIHAKRAWV